MKRRAEWSVSAESREIAAIVDAFPPDIRQRLLESMQRRAALYALGSHPRHEGNPRVTAPRHRAPPYLSPCCNAKSAVSRFSYARKTMVLACSKCGQRRIERIDRQQGPPKEEGKHRHLSLISSGARTDEKR